MHTAFEVRHSSVFEQDKTGRTPLHLAAQSGFVECCRLLLLAVSSKKPELNDRDEFGMTCLHLCTYKG